MLDKANSRGLSALACAMAIASLLPVTAMADESWASAQYGDIVYEKDVGDTAVLSMAGGHPGSRVYIYLPGLAGNTSERGEFNGYWIESAPGECATDKTGADGLQSNLWGDVQVEFENPGYPSGFIMRMGSCGGEFTDEAWADPS